jgi:flagella basal body P-ring formation protein FlgA
MLFPTVDALAAIVRFRAEVKSAKPLVRLVDIAEVAAATPTEQARLEGLAIAPAPAAGRSVRLDFADVRSRLEALGVDLAGTEFAGASSTIVTTPEAEKAPVKQTVAIAVAKPAAPVRVEARKPLQVTDQQARRLEELFSQEVERYLARQEPPVRDVDVTVALDRSSLDALAGMAVGLIAGSGSVTLSETAVETSPSSKVAGDVRTFDLHCRDAKGESRTIRPVCRITPWPRVVQIKGTVSRGAVLRAEDLVERPVAPDRHDPETHPSGMKDLVGRETTRLLRGGETVRLEDVRDVALVRRGELVTVTSRKGGISVRVEARSLDEGSLGQSVTVVALDGKTKYVARVVAYHEVEVGVAATNSR